MTDEDLRALERRAQEGDLGARLAHAAALERLGRRDDALGALLLSVEHEEARRRIASFPAWTHREGSAGNTRHVDAAPLETLPRVGWTRRSPRDEHVIAASELGIVTCVVGTDRVLVLEPETGRVRREHRRARREPGPVVGGDSLLLARGRTVVAYDLWTGTVRFRLSVEGEPWGLRAAGQGVFVGAGDSVVAFRPEDGELTPTWTRRLEPSLPPHPDERASTLSATDGTVLVRCHGELLALDATTGETRWSFPGHPYHVRADARGVATRRYGSYGPYGFDLLDRDGATVKSESSEREAWSADPVVLLPESLVVLRHRELEQYPPRDESVFTLALVSRVSGAETDLISEDESISWPVVAAARDVVFYASDYTQDSIGAFRPGARGALWSFDSSPLGRVNRLVPLPRRLLVEGNGSLTCLVELQRSATPGG